MKKIRISSRECFIDEKPGRLVRNIIKIVEAPVDASIPVKLEYPMSQTELDWLCDIFMCKFNVYNSMGEIIKYKN